MAKKADLKVVRGIGDNGDEKSVDGKKLLGFVESIEKLNKKKDQVLQEIRETYADIKAVGFDSKTVRFMVKERSMEPEKCKEQEELRTVYRAALNMLDDDE